MPLSFHVPLLGQDWKAYTAVMTARKVCLKAVMVIRNGKRSWSGEYECSICGLHFRPDPNDAAKLSRDFAEHAECEHAQAKQ